MENVLDEFVDFVKVMFRQNGSGGCWFCLVIYVKIQEE